MKIGDAEFDQAVEVTLAWLREAARRAEDDPEGSVTYRELSEHLASAFRDLAVDTGG